MKNLNKYLAVAVMVGAATGVSAQALNSGYFLDGYLFKHQLNPALESDKAYFSIPVLGNINIGTRGNIGLGNFLYPTANGGLTTFMNSSISAEEFLNGLSTNNKLAMNLDMSILSAGFRAWGGFNTIDIGLRSHTSVNIPKDMLEFMKVGQSGPTTVYDMGDMGMSSANYVEVALGHSRQITDKLRVGAKVKFLLGGMYADMSLKNTHVTLSEKEWIVSANGEMNIAAKGMTVPEKDGGLVDFDNIEYDSPGLSGFGLGIDLGATYEVIDNLTVSAAIKDLGFIGWSNNTYASTNNEAWRFDGFENLTFSDEKEDDKLENQLDDLGDEFEDYANLHRRSTGEKLSKALAATLVVGAEYALPMYDKLSFGLLSTTRFNGPYTWSEGRLSANVSPLSWLEGGVNVAVSSFGTSAGWILNLHPKGFSIFLGMDCLVGKVNPQFIPVNNANASVSCGFNVTF
ncbi:DUF5723 family protein [Bacteroides caecigallinarum]|uniref:DUF5723 family protein n=1 Tax=Bacteroides caecigallinarum TaxID=1411144 RepID=UPI001F2AF215|nr:DUF5723 family protein [Bacteroides caecigallinarum]